jgi:hypothetical protein
VPSTLIEKSQVATIAGALLRKTGATASELMKQVRVFKADLAKRPETALPDPSALLLPEQHRQALIALANNADTVPVPHKRRVLNGPELTSYIRLMEHLAVVKKAVTRLDSNAKQVLHNHFDARLDNEKGVTDATPFHPTAGWYAVEDKTGGQVSGEQIKITRETSGGGPVVTEATLAAMREANVIDEVEYQRLTRVPRYREVNDDAVIAKVNADPAFADKLLQFADEVAPTPSINLRAAK